MKPLTYLINCAPEGAPAEWHQAGEQFKDSEDVVAVIAYSEYQAQAKRIEELEAATEHLGLTPKQAADGLARHKAQVAEIESLRKQVEELEAESAKDHVKIPRLKDALSAYGDPDIFADDED